jgi:hypothetical protein
MAGLCRPKGVNDAVFDGQARACGENKIAGAQAPAI